MAKWDVLWQSFLLTFSFNDGFERINEALQEIKETISRTPKELVEWTQPYWSTQLCHVLECYNVIAEEEDDLQNITIPETEGWCAVEGAKIANPNISEHFKT